MTEKARCRYCGNDPNWCPPGYCCPASQLEKERDEARGEVERLRRLLAAANNRITALTGEVPFSPESE